MKLSYLEPSVLALSRAPSRFRNSYVPIINREFSILFFSLLLSCCVYIGVLEFLHYCSTVTTNHIEIAINGFSCGASAFLGLLLFSNIITALGFFFTANDLPLLLVTPVSPLKFFFMRFFKTVLNSSWMIVLFITPAILAYRNALSLPYSFIIVVSLALLPSVVIPSALSVSFVTFFAAFVPVRVMQRLFYLFAAIVSVLLVFAGNHLALDVASAKGVGLYLEFIQTNSSIILPATLLTGILEFYLGKSDSVALPLFMLYYLSLGLLFVAYSFHRLFYYKGWNLIQDSSGQRMRRRAPRASLSKLIRHYIFPRTSQLHAIALKEMRTLIRDPIQSLQMILLLSLSFIYLYNFKSVSSLAPLTGENRLLWYVTFGSSNLLLASCVSAAIAMRFVFPSISLEGQAYVLIRSAPIDLPTLLKHKYRVWLFPLEIASVLLTILGGISLQFSSEVLVASVPLVIANTAGIVGLAVGIGSMFAKFDWETPAELAASFGSIVFMICAFMTIFATILPSCLVFALIGNYSALVTINPTNYYIALLFSYFLIYLLNLGIARLALRAGARNLATSEKY